MKKIGITTRIILEEKFGETRDSLDYKWIEILSYIGFTPVIIPTGVNYPNYIKTLNIEGLIFSGGDDLFSFSNNDISKIRDKKEALILDFAIKECLPVYGVCRGMQFIAEHFGSTFKKLSNHVAENHAINLANSFWGSDYIKNLHTVNSYHNFGINQLGDKLLSVAEAEDGSVEAFIHKSLKIFCQMWHPEREEHFNVLDLKLMKNFFND